MAEYQGGVEHVLQTSDQVEALEPGVVVAREPALRVRLRVVFLDVELVRGPNEGAVVLEVDLHDAQARCVAGAVVQRDALVEHQTGVAEGLPVQFLEVQVVCQVGSRVGAGCGGPAGVFQPGISRQSETGCDEIWKRGGYVLHLVDVDGHVGSEKVLQPAGVVWVQVPEDDGFHILDVVASGFDGGWELVLLVVAGERKVIGRYLVSAFLQEMDQRVRLWLVVGSWMEGLASSGLSENPVSKRMQPKPGYSIRATSTINSRRLFGGFGSLIDDAFAP